MSSLEGAVAPPRTTDRTRSLKWLRYVAALIALSITTFGVIWIPNYEPLQFGSASGIRPPSALLRTIDQYGDPARVWLMKVQPGTVFTYYFTLRNDGPVGITVKEPIIDAHSEVAFRLVGIRSGIPTEGFDMDPKNLRLFEEFALAPGEEHLIGLKYQFLDCKGLRGGIGQSQVELRFAVLGVERHQTVEFDSMLLADRAQGSCEGI